MVGDIVAAHQQGDGQHRGQDRLAHEPLTFAFCLCLEVSHVRHVAADRALDVLGLDAEGSLTPRYASQHALHEVVIVVGDTGCAVAGAALGSAP